MSICRHAACGRFPPTSCCLRSFPTPAMLPVTIIHTTCTCILSVFLFHKMLLPATAFHQRYFKCGFMFFSLLPRLRLLPTRIRISPTILCEQAHGSNVCTVFSFAALDEYTWFYYYPNSSFPTNGSNKQELKCVHVQQECVVCDV